MGCESLVNVTKLLSCVNLSLPIQNDKKLKIVKIKGRNIKFVERVESRRITLLDLTSYIYNRKLLVAAFLLH